MNPSAKGKLESTKKYFKRLKQANPARLDDVFHQLHDAVFEHTDCLTCANCCKTTSPIFYPTDIDRIAKSMHLKPGFFIDKYLRIDEDNDYVLKQSPCAFLQADNRCSIYAYRPKACREYPHTNRKKMIQLLDLTAKNTVVCPAVFEIVERLKNLIPA